MFRKALRCPNCGYPIKEEWSYCPNCGYLLGFRRFEDFFEDIDKEIRSIIKQFFRPFEIRFEDFEKEPYIRTAGISIRIESGTGKKPKIYVKTFGDYKDLEPKIKEQLAKKYGIEEVKEEEKVKEVREIKVTEEPEAKIRRIGQKIEIEIDLPEVSSEKDIEINELEESIEIKAYAKDKAYFKIIAKPANKHISEKKFENGKLKIILE